MNSYWIDRLCSDARHVLDRAKLEAKLPHGGVMGRFRELLVDNLLAPWLPPYVACGTGLILGTGNTEYFSGQEDIVLYDKTLAPPILASNSAPEGVFLSSSVLGRIEVKSTLDAKCVQSFIASSRKVAALRTNSDPPMEHFNSFNSLFAFTSDLKADDKADNELRRVIGQMHEASFNPLLVNVICVADRGLWTLLLPREEQQARVRKSTCKLCRLKLRDPVDPVAWFVERVSYACFVCHADRLGRAPGLDCGITYYLDPFPFEIVDNQ